MKNNKRKELIEELSSWHMNNYDDPYFFYQAYFERLSDKELKEWIKDTTLSYSELKNENKKSNSGDWL